MEPDYKEIVRRIVAVIEASREHEPADSDEATVRDVEAFDDICQLLHHEELL